MVMGRPTDYSIEKADYICDVIATSMECMQDICDRDENFPSNETTVYAWMRKYDDFKQKYLEARELQGILYSNKVMKVIWECPETNESVAKANLILRGSQWHLSKLAPKQFGDKKQVTQEMNINVHERDLQDLK